MRRAKTADSPASLGATNWQGDQTASPVGDTSNMPEGYYANPTEVITSPFEPNTLRRASLLRSCEPLRRWCLKPRTIATARASQDAWQTSAVDYPDVMA